MMISPAEIHLWFANDAQIAHPPLLDRYRGLLNEDERQRHLSYRFARHRHQYLISRALVRSVLSHYADEVAPREWHFATNAHGKPFIQHPQVPLPLRFNLSHTEQMVVMAVALNHEVGVDIEWLHRSGQTVELADRFFAPSEADQLRALPKQARRQRFFELWTLKEAYIKACGMGLSIPLQHFSFAFPRRGGIRIAFTPERNDQPRTWQFWHIAPSEGHRLSVAVKRDSPDLYHRLQMRNTIPLVDTHAVDYPIVLASAEAS